MLWLIGGIQHPLELSLCSTLIGDLHSEDDEHWVIDEEYPNVHWLAEEGVMY